MIKMLKRNEKAKESIIVKNNYLKYHMKNLLITLIIISVIGFAANQAFAKYLNSENNVQSKLDLLEELKNEKAKNTELIKNQTYLIDRINREKEYCKNFNESCSLTIASNEFLEKEIVNLLNSIKNIELKCDCLSTKVIADGCYKYFEKISKSLANQKNYVADEYDCNQYSQALSNRLNELGWQAQTYNVKIKDCESIKLNCQITNYHQIVKVRNIFVEATNGEIIHPDDYESYGIPEYEGY